MPCWKHEFITPLTGCSMCDINERVEQEAAKRRMALTAGWPSIEGVFSIANSSCEEDSDVVGSPCPRPVGAGLGPKEPDRTMMKARDISVATALLINGYQRANEENGNALAEALAGIRKECDDWAENLALDDKHALEPSEIGSIDIRVGQADVSRTPYNLMSAAMCLVSECIDLNGMETFDLLAERLAAMKAHHEKEHASHPGTL